MSCNEIRSVLADFLEDNLSSSGSAEVREHVRGCQSCGLELERLSHVGLLLMEWAPPAAPPTIWVHLASYLPTPARRSAARGLRLGLAMAAAATIFVIGWALGVRPLLDRDFVGARAPVVDRSFDGTVAAPVAPPREGPTPTALEGAIPPQDGADGPSHAAPPSKTPADTRTSTAEPRHPTATPLTSPPGSP